MTRAFAILALGCALAGPAAAQAQTPAQAPAAAPTGGGALAELVPPKAGAAACFVRSYDPAHLSAHPRQKVAAIAVMIRWQRHDPPATDGYWPFAVGVTLKGRRKQVTTGGDCMPSSGGSVPGSAAGFPIACPIDCDAGSLSIAPQGTGQIRVSIPRKESLVFGDNCDGGGPGTFVLSAEPDDHDFVLDRADAVACRSLRDNLP